MIKKTITSLVGVTVVGGGLYYATSQKLVADEIDTNLATLKSYGFTIEDRKETADGEHFVISLADMHKFSKLLPQYEDILLAKDASVLKKFKLGIDLTSSASDISVDIYPVALPTDGLSAEAKETMNRYISQRTLTLHIDYNPLTNSFDGNVKDIDEKIREDIAVQLAGFTFDGSIDDEKIALNYRLNRFGLRDKKDPVVEIEGISSEGTYEGLSYYITNSNTNIDKISLKKPMSTDIISLIDSNIKVTSDIKNDLFESRLSTVTKHIDSSIRNRAFSLDNFIFDYGVKNINIQAYNKLVTLMDGKNPNLKSQEVEKCISDIFKEGMVLDIYKIGMDNISYDGKSYKGLSLQSNVEVANDPNLLQTLQTRPLQALNSLKADAQVKISDEIFTQIQKDPRGRMTMMIQPKEQNGYKVYDIGLDNAQLKVNGRRMM